MNNITGSKEFDTFLKEKNPNGVEMKLSIEEMMLIQMLRNKDTAIVEVKKAQGEILRINTTEYFTTDVSNTERIVRRYKNNGQVNFTPLGGTALRVKVVMRLK